MLLGKRVCIDALHAIGAVQLGDLYCGASKPITGACQTAAEPFLFDPFACALPLGVHHGEYV